MRTTNKYDDDGDDDAGSGRVGRSIHQGGEKTMTSRRLVASRREDIESALRFVSISQFCIFPKLRAHREVGFLLRLNRITRGCRVSPWPGSPQATPEVAPEVAPGSVSGCHVTRGGPQ